MLFFVCDKLALAVNVDVALIISIFVIALLLVGMKREGGNLGVRFEEFLDAILEKISLLI